MLSNVMAATLLHGAGDLMATQQPCVQVVMEIHGKTREY